MSPPLLIASDVDGTLIDSADILTDRTRSVITAAVEAGAQFLLATGRPPRWIKPIVDALGFAPVSVCANGSVLYDAASDRIISAATLGSDELTVLSELIRKVIPDAGLAVERVGASAHDAATPQFVSSPGYEHAWLNPDNTEVSLDDLLGSPAIKLLVRRPGVPSSAMAEALAPVVGAAGADLTYSTENGLVELMPAGISKASGVAAVARQLAVPAESAIAFGDMPNDVAMLQWAGHGVAMGNAHPRVHAAANESTVSNDDDGVAKVLERWWD